MARKKKLKQEERDQLDQFMGILDLAFGSDHEAVQNALKALMTITVMCHGDKLDDEVEGPWSRIMIRLNMLESEVAALKMAESANRGYVNPQPQWPRNGEWYGGGHQFGDIVRSDLTDGSNNFTNAVSGITLTADEAEDIKKRFFGKTTSELVSEITNGQTDQKGTKT